MPAQKLEHHGEAGPVSALMMLQKQVPGERLNCWHLLRERMQSDQCLWQKARSRRLVWTTPVLREKGELWQAGRSGLLLLLLFWLEGKG